LETNKRGTATMNSKLFEQEGSAGAYQTAGTTSNAASPYYVILTIPSSESGAGEGVQPTYVKYAESATDQLNCVAKDEQQILYSGYTLGETGAMHTTVPGQQQYSGNATAVTNCQVESNITRGSNEGQLVAQGNGAYYVERSFNPQVAHILTATQTLSLQSVTAESERECRKMVPSNKIINTSLLDAYEQPDLSLDKYNSLAAILWVRDNFEVSDGASIPCSKAYNHYFQYCSEHKITSLTDAAFGKFVRLVFFGVNTRRFGTRGHNSYHYCGIELKSGLLLNEPSEDTHKLCKLSGSNGGDSVTQKIEHWQEQNTNHSAGSNHFNSEPRHLYHFHNPGDGSLSMPEIPDVVFPIGTTLPEDSTVEDVVKFRSVYTQHCEAFLHAVVKSEFHIVEGLLREFWRYQSTSDSECENENYLSKTKMYLLCKFGPVQQFVRRVDYLFYQKLVDILIPDVLRPIPGSTTQAIRSFANELKSWMKAAMMDCPEEVVHIKVSTVTTFAQTLQRYISLNQLAQGARPVLQDSSQTDQMLSDLIRIDLSSVKERVTWACQGDGCMLQLEADFKKMLYNQKSLEEWAAWLKGVVTEVLKPYEGKQNIAKAAKEFLLNWSFYNSLVVRDLTLRKAPSFGSLYLILLLCEEYMFFLIVHQVAMETGEVPLLIMGERNNINPFSETLSSQDPIMGVSPLQWDLMTLLEDDAFQSTSTWYE
jgi:regulatory factor X 1/2/3